MKKNFFLLPVFFALVFFACGQAAKADTWTTKYLVDKATSESLYAVYGTEDSEGNCWFSTASLDGDPNNNKLFEYTAAGNWADQTDVVNNLVTSTNKGKGSMYGDKSGNLWMIVGGLLLKHNSSGWSSLSPADISQAVYGSSLGDFITSVFGDTDGNLFVLGRLAGHDAVVKRTPEGNWSEVFSGGPPLSDSSAWVNNSKGFYNKATNAFWFYVSGSSYGVFRYSGGQWTVFTSADGLSDNTPYDMAVGSNGNVWVIFSNGSQDAASKGLSRFNGSAWTTYTAGNSGLTTGTPKQLAEDKEGKIWITTIGGEYDATVVSVFDPSVEAWSYFSPRNSLDQFRGINRTFFFSNGFWGSTEGSNSVGFIVAQSNDVQATVYGQVGGTVVEEASLGALKKAKSKKVTIYKMTQKKNKRWKAKVYRKTKTASGWYKSLNLPVGRYKVKVGSSAKTIQITNGDPYRLNFR